MSYFDSICTHKLKMVYIYKLNIPKVDTSHSMRKFFDKYLR